MNLAHTIIYCVFPKYQTMMPRKHHRRLLSWLLWQRLHLLEPLEQRHLLPPGQHYWGDDNVQSEYLNKTKLNTFEVATCGQGASCAGQCSAVDASLCPSGNCTDDPGTCDLELKSENFEDEQSGGSTATYSGSDLSWCTGDGCRVRVHPECCYNPNCLTENKRADACDWLKYLTGMNKGGVWIIGACKILALRKLVWPPAPSAPNFGTLVDMTTKNT